MASSYGRSYGLDTVRWYDCSDFKKIVYHHIQLLLYSMYGASAGTSWQRYGYQRPSSSGFHRINRVASHCPNRVSYKRRWWSQSASSFHTLRKPYLSSRQTCNAFLNSCFRDVLLCSPWSIRKYVPTCFRAHLGSNYLGSLHFCDYFLSLG